MNLNDLATKMSPDEWSALTDLQRKLHENFSKRGVRRTQYLGREFSAPTGVFPPRPDSIALVQKMVIKHGDHVLDVCAGSGVVGIFAAFKGAASVVGLEMNPDAAVAAVKNARKNRVYVDGEHPAYECRVSDMFDALRPDEQFDVIVMNPPFRNVPANRLVERTTWDDDMRAHRVFLSQVRQCRKPGGRIFMSQASFGDLAQVQILLDENHFTAELIGQRPFRIHNLPELFFYAFELKDS